MIQRLGAQARCLQQDAQVLLDLVLADVIIEPSRAQTPFLVVLLAHSRGYDAVFAIFAVFGHPSSLSRAYSAREHLFQRAPVQYSIRGAVETGRIEWLETGALVPIPPRTRPLSVIAPARRHPGA